MVGGKNDVTRLFFLAHLAVVHEMEWDHLKETGRKSECLFEPNLREAVRCGTSKLTSAVSTMHAPPAESNKKQKANIALVKWTSQCILVPCYTCCVLSRLYDSRHL
jgi:hypothetical protein